MHASCTVSRLPSHRYGAGLNGIEAFPPTGEGYFSRL